MTETEAAARVREFRLVRDEDVSGVSGTGVVAVGVQLPTGRCIVEWLPGRVDVRSIVVYANIGEVETVHGHDGKTRVEWADDTLSVMFEANDELREQVAELLGKVTHTDDDRELRSAIFDEAVGFPPEVRPMPMFWLSSAIDDYMDSLVEKRLAAALEARTAILGCPLVAQLTEALRQAEIAVRKLVEQTPVQDAQSFLWRQSLDRIHAALAAADAQQSAP